MAESVDAFILAAGRGERLRPLTDTVPKPLIRVGDSALIEYLLRALARAGIRNVVINHAHLGALIKDVLEDGARYRVHIRYSDESQGVLDTAGGIIKALPLVRSDPFVVVNGDIWTDYRFEALPRRIAGLAHLVLVDNPPHNPDGDFCLDGDRVCRDKECARQRLTFSGIGLYSKSLFESRPAKALALAPVIAEAAERDLVSGEHYSGVWIDVGTPERLRELRRMLEPRS